MVPTRCGAQAGRDSLAAALGLQSTATHTSIWEHLWVVRRLMEDEQRWPSRSEQAAVITQLGHVYQALHQTACQAHATAQVWRS